MLTRLIKYATKNILRNKFISISSILILSLLMFFINILLILHNVSFNLINDVNSKLSINLYLKDAYNKNSVEIINLKQNIRDLSENIKIEIKNKEEVLELLKKKDPELVKIINDTNPLPATISLSEIELGDYDALNNIINSKKEILSSSEQNKTVTSDYSSQYNRIKKVISILSSLKIGLYIIIAIFLLSISVIIYSIINNFIYYYREEIQITKLVGGSNIFIYGPFSIQGLIYSVLSFILSFTIFLIILKNINLVFKSTSYSNYIFSGNYYILFFSELIIFGLIGLMSGYISSKKYLK